jgi:hypothetical protein
VVISSHVLVCVLNLQGNGCNWGEGVTSVVRRLCLAFPPSYLFKSNVLHDWAIWSLGIYHSFLGHNPVQPQ